MVAPASAANCSSTIGEAGTIRGLLRSMSAQRGDATFLISPDFGGTWSYAEFESLAARVAQGLRQVGLRKGHRVASLLVNGRGAVELLIGAMHGGFVPVPLNPFAGRSAL